MVTLKAATHSRRRSGAWLTSSSTVARAEGPASAGMASGTISGSWLGTGLSGVGGPKIMRSAIKNSTRAPPMSSETSDKLIARRKACPANMKASSTTKAISTSRTMTRLRRWAGTALRLFTKIGILPNGSVISRSKMVAEAKLCSMAGTGEPACAFDRDRKRGAERVKFGNLLA